MLVYYRRQSILVLGLLDQFNFYDQYRPRTFPTVGKTIYYTASLLLIYSFSFSIQLFIFHKSPGTGVGNALIPTLSLSLDRIQYLWTVNRFFYGPRYPFQNFRLNLHSIYLNLSQLKACARTEISRYGPPLGNLGPLGRCKNILH